MVLEIKKPHDDPIRESSQHCDIHIGSEFVLIILTIWYVDINWNCSGGGIMILEKVCSLCGGIPWQFVPVKMCASCSLGLTTWTGTNKNGRSLLVVAMHMKTTQISECCWHVEVAPNLRMDKGELFNNVSKKLTFLTWHCYQHSFIPKEKSRISCVTRGSGTVFLLENSKGGHDFKTSKVVYKDITVGTVLLTDPIAASKLPAILCNLVTKVKFFLLPDDPSLYTLSKHVWLSLSHECKTAIRRFSSSGNSTQIFVSIQIHWPQECDHFLGRLTVGN